MHQRYGRLQEEYAQTVDRFYGDLGADTGNGPTREPLMPLPHEEVRDYFNRCNNYIDSLDQLGETRFHFARHGGACPLWHVHEAFAQPERILTQVAEMPDGMRFFGIARTTGRGGFRSRRKLFAIGLGCELAHAHELVYADGTDLEHPRDVVPIGPGCRVQGRLRAAQPTPHPVSPRRSREPR